MDATEHTHRIAEAAWAFLRDQGIPATPRNYELAYAYRGLERPPLTRRIDAMLRAGERFSPGVLDALHREHFAAGCDPGVLRDSSGELQQIASELESRVSTDGRIMRDVGRAIGSVADALQSASGVDEIHIAALTLSNRSSEMGQRMEALEQLFTASVRRIAQLRQRLAKAEQDATRDPLTGLANRRLFETALRKAALRCAADRVPMSLLMLDIDHFKRFNDAHGHLLGDSVLRLFAAVLKESIKGRDTAARYGGEEFAIILPGASVEGGVAVAELIRRLLAQHPIVNRATGQRLGVITCSIGVAEHHPQEPVGELIARADQALFRAKHEGRNRVCAG